MRDSNRILCAITCGLVLTAPAIVLGQDTAPARETPRPQDIDPAVNTSATPPADSDAPAKPAPSGAAETGQITPAGEPSSGAPRNPRPSAAPSSAPQSTPKQGAASSSDGKKGKALDRLELDTTQITGNRELPKVLYIVPWKRADLGDLVGKPVNSLLDEVLTPVDRDVFKRENRYYRALAPAEGQPQGTNGAAPAAAAPGAATSTGSAAPPARDER